jgi:hypothetical protein
MSVFRYCESRIFLLGANAGYLTFKSTLSENGFTVSCRKVIGDLLTSFFVFIFQIIMGLVNGSAPESLHLQYFRHENCVIQRYGNPGKFTHICPLTSSYLLPPSLSSRNCIEYRLLYSVK